jgi:enoyl-CoA hydratase/carnithine racemase
MIAPPSMRSKRGDVCCSLDSAGIGTIEIQRPPNNFVTVRLVDDLATTCEGLAAAGCRAVVLCSEGENFSAGTDLRVNPRSAQGAGDRSHFCDAAMRLFEQPLVLVAALQGEAVGAGVGLAMAADFRVVSTASRLHLNFARLGLHHGFGLTVTLSRAIGYQRAQDLLYSGVSVTGGVAVELGLADRLTAPGGERAAARSLASLVSFSDPLAVRAIRQTMRRELIDDVREALNHERIAQERLVAMTDIRDGVDASTDPRDAGVAGN